MEAASFRQGFVPAADIDGQTFLDCLPAAAGEDRVVGIEYGPGGDLGWRVLTRCRWTVVADEHGPFWRIDTVYEWTVDEQFGRYRETYWIDAAGVVVAKTSSGDVPPAGDPTATPDPTPQPMPSAPAWGPWPPDDAFAVIELKEEGGRKPMVAVIDGSGALTSVAEAAPDGDVTADLEGVFRDPSGDRRIRIRWTSSICDVRMRLSIADDIGRVVIEHAPRDGCDAMGIGRELVLEFARASIRPLSSSSWSRRSSCPNLRLRRRS